MNPASNRPETYYGRSGIRHRLLECLIDLFHSFRIIFSKTPITPSLSLGTRFCSDQGRTSTSLDHKGVAATWRGREIGGSSVLSCDEWIEASTMAS
ncbi:hypothetical protein E2542_SST25113 [Spatholobus suberectus]|nr:hypothetical protein E2542_SST25113 [Spatholobus suberectus]